MSEIICSVCNRGFTSARYYKAHFRYKANEKCKAAFDGEKPATAPEKRALEGESTTNNKEKQSRIDSGDLIGAHKYIAKSVIQMLQIENSRMQSQEYRHAMPSNSEEDEDFFVLGGNSDDEDENLEQGEEENEQQPVLDTDILHDFEEYCESKRNNTCELAPEYAAGIELMSMLVKKGAPLNLYDAIYKWHTKHLEAKMFVNRKRLLKDLNLRYHLDNKGPEVVHSLVLPHSQSRIDLVVHNAMQQIQSLLTDPRINDSDYNFFGNNPLEPPPEAFTSISDLNTGRCYRETYKKMIKDPTTEVLLPLIFYMDGAVTGQYDALPIESLKFTLGIFNKITRDKGFAWRSLGYVTKFLKETTQAEDLVRGTGGMDADIFLSDSDTDNESEGSNNSDSEREDNTSVNTGQEEEESDDDDDNNMEPNIKSCSGQDLHAMLDTMLRGIRKLQKKGGFWWNLPYNGQVFRVKFLPFVMFIKGDSVEHDKHCGSYTSRTSGVKQLCRYCCCPNDKTDEAYRKDTPKTPKMIISLLEAGDAEGLQGLSQQNIDNAWYKLGFGLHNDFGVHGACPIEMLHYLQIGKYKYARGMFFEQTGKDSILSTKINALAKAMGFLFKRQSDRELPRTMFAKGIKKGKLMAHEMSGLILVLVAVLRSTKGRHTLLHESRGNQKQYFGQPEFIRDWIMFLETLLQWESWMKQPELQVFDVKRFETKVREIMEMEKKIGRRQSGMQFRTFNFHASLHLSDDMLNFGVPSVVNTMSNESHHKPDKIAAMRTQRVAKVFDLQCAKQIHNMRIVDYGVQEIESGEKVWEYFDVEETDKEMSVSHQQPQKSFGVDTENTGARASFFFNKAKSEYCLKVDSRMKKRHKFQLGDELNFFLEETKELLGDDVDNLPIFTEHKRLGQIFRGSPHYRGKPWRDWVMIDWGDDGILPAQIWCFLDLQAIPQGLAYPPGIYAVAESASEVDDEDEKELSDLFIPYIKETNEDGDGNISRKFYLIDVEAFHAPAVVIPDIGNDNEAAFLRLLPRSTWADQFVQWLHEPHTREFTD